jgi:hypothetical protein
MKSLFLIFLTAIYFTNLTPEFNTPPKFAWEFVSIEDDMGVPRTTIYLLVDGKKHEIGKGTGNFNELEKAFFNNSQYQIPKEALSACTGFWAGLGHQICVIQKGNILEIKEGFLEAESPKRTKVKFKTIKKITLP